MQIIRWEDQKKVTWAGGTALELAVWPEGADYAEQTFLWRMSAAEVTEEQTQFTRLPDYQRFMGIREGALLLNHGTNTWYYRNPRFPAVWDGAAPTISKGRASNLNVMIRKDCEQGAIESVLTKSSCAGGYLRDIFDLREALQSSDLGLEPKKRADCLEGDIFALFVSSGDSIELRPEGTAEFVRNNAVPAECGEQPAASVTLRSGDLAIWSLRESWKRTEIVSCGDSQLFGVWIMRKM